MLHFSGTSRDKLLITRIKADEVYGLSVSSAPWAAKSTGTGVVSYSEHFSNAGRILVASRSVAPPTRLETRTKESNMWSSH